MQQSMHRIINDLIITNLIRITVIYTKDISGGHMAHYRVAVRTQARPLRTYHYDKRRSPTRTRHGDANTAH